MAVDLVEVAQVVFAMLVAAALFDSGAGWLLAGWARWAGGVTLELEAGEPRLQLCWVCLAGESRGAPVGQEPEDGKDGQPRPPGRQPAPRSFCVCLAVKSWKVAASLLALLFSHSIVPREACSESRAAALTLPCLLEVAGTP